MSEAPDLTEDEAFAAEHALGVLNARERADAEARMARDEAVRSGSLAAMTLMLAAAAKGLASGPMIGFDPDGVRREFKIPERYLPVLLLPVGHAAPGNWPRKPRLPAGDVLRFDSGEGL